MSGQGIRVNRALISVADKEGVVELAGWLAGKGVEVVSTGGTGKVLREAGIDIVDASELTGFTEALGGRLKTLHPALLGGILHDRDRAEQEAELKAIGAKPIDLVVVNFYPFAKRAVAGMEMDELIELIDIGGPTMVRSAAKNYRHVTVVTNPADYSEVLRVMAGNSGSVPKEVARQFATKAFAATAAYEAGIAAAMAGSPVDVAASLVGNLVSLRELAYGENPHQSGWVGASGDGLRQLGGGKISYNNLQDAVAAWRCVEGHAVPCCAIIKHSSPCGVAVCADVANAHAKALAADPVSAYGGVVACNREIDCKTLESINKVFSEVVVAPSYSAEAEAVLVKAKRLRALVAPLGAEHGLDAKIFGGLALVQQRDSRQLGEDDWEQVSRDAPDESCLANLKFAWKVVRNVRSNAIVLAKDNATIGIGAGQTSRVEATQLAVSRAVAKGFTTEGAVAASDAFFPFPDAVEVLATAGVRAIIQPGGSKRDAEVIASADAAGMVMLTTGLRHFVH